MRPACTIDSKNRSTWLLHGTRDTSERLQLLSYSNNMLTFFITRSVVWWSQTGHIDVAMKQFWVIIWFAPIQGVLPNVQIDS